MRKWLLVVLAVAVVVLGALLPLLLPRPSPVTRAAFDRIKVGMTRAEVEAILGGPPGDYTTGPVFSLDYFGGGVLMCPGELRGWLGDEGTVWVGVDRAGVVLWKRFAVMHRVELEPLETLRWRLDRLKERLQKVVGK